jgi:hypothetical protein
MSFDVVRHAGLSSYHFFGFFEDEARSGGGL